MRKRWTVFLWMAFTIGGVDQAAKAQDQEAVVQAAEEAAASILEGDMGEVSEADRNACTVLKAGIEASDLGIDPSTVQYRPSGMSKVIKHALCSAWWDRPNKDALDDAYGKAIVKYMTTGKEERGEKPQIPKTTNELHLTILHPTYDTDQEAVASLEQSVADLTKGISFVIQGKERTTQVDFDPWIEGVGNRATWAPSKNELHVAASGTRFTLSIRIYDEKADNRAKAIEMAPKIIDAL